MKRTRQPHTAPLALPALRLEGGLLLPGVLEQAAQGRASKQALADYGIPKSLTINDECSRAFQIACALWHDFAAHMQRADAALDAAPRTTRFIHELLHDAFGYTTLQPATTSEAGELRYPVTFLAGSLPILVAPHTLGLDGAHLSFAPQGGGSRKKTAFQSLQDLLNASPAHLWGIVSNGRQIRLLRDAASLTRPSYLEIDLETLLSEQHWADFKSLWLILHASRAPLGSNGDDCIWEHWRTQGQTEGARVREGLRHNVENALTTLGKGFIAHPANDELRQRLHSGALTTQHYFQQLLRLIYRFIFLITVEERNLLHPPESTPAARAAYAQGYALARLRPLCLRRRLHTRHSDQWDAIRIVFAGLEAGQPRLALPALGGLFDADQCPDLDAAQLANAHLLGAMQHLRWARPDPKAGLLPIDWRNMDSEEMGSVYESLLELTPTVDLTARTFRFAAAAGNARKLTGSYYTPSSLVDQLIRSALDPVIEQRLAAAPTPAAGAAALLTIRVIDPACGSGHFLLAAARRLAEKLATLQSLESGAEGAITQEGWRTALRAVTAHCIYGVDRNPLAIELARMSLWLEAHDASRPLSFLDHHLQVGDALLGIATLAVLKHGIPKEAYKPLTGDDKAACKALAKDNATALKQLSKSIPLFDISARLTALRFLENEAGDTTASIAAQRRAWADLQAADEGEGNLIATAADLCTGAWLLPKTAGAPCPTTATLLRMIDCSPTESDKAAIAAARTACRDARVLHWPLAFPQVFMASSETKSGNNGVSTACRRTKPAVDDITQEYQSANLPHQGFDCVLGNPPWDMLQLDPQEFFAVRDPDIANAKNMAARNKMIDALRDSSPILWREYQQALHETETAQAFTHFSGRFPASGFGRLNLAYLFTELFLTLKNKGGRAGLIVPSGIATDSFSQHLFNKIADGNLISFYDIENKEAIFDSVHRSYKFCLLTLGKSDAANFVCFATNIAHLSDTRRQFQLAPQDFQLLNPNTGTCPVFRTSKDAELTKKIYHSIPVLWREKTETQAESNPWGLELMLMFMMNTDSYRFKDAPTPDRLPLYEGKLIHQFDHRWATYTEKDSARTKDGDREKLETRDATDDEKRDPAFTVQPRYWVEEYEVLLKIASLPLGLQRALQTKDIDAAVLCLTQQLFARFLAAHRQQHPGTGAYPAWQAFCALHPYALTISPTQLGLVGDNPACFRPLNGDYLPAASETDVIPYTPEARHTTAWYAIDPKAEEAILDLAAQYAHLPAPHTSLPDTAAAFALTLQWLHASCPKWLMGWRDITNATNERTVIASVIPLAAVGNNMPLMLFQEKTNRALPACLLANLSTLVFDFVARHKTGGIHLNFFIYKQLPVLPPERYARADLDFIVPRVLELTYSAHDMRPWAEDVWQGWQTVKTADGDNRVSNDRPQQTPATNGINHQYQPISHQLPPQPYPFDPERRAILRAELDAYYAHLYGLTEEDLRYILDPASIMGADWPSETFRVLRDKELKQYGEYRTQRLVLEAFSKITREVSP